MVAVADDLNRSAVGSFPKPNSVIKPGACQYTSIGMPRHASHAPLMSTQHASQPPTRRLPHLPAAHHSLSADTSQLCAIVTPGQLMYERSASLFCLPRQRMQAASAAQLPQLEATIMASARQHTAVRSKGQVPHPAALSRERLDTVSHRSRLSLPESNRTSGVATGKPLSIGTPRQREDRVRMRQFLKTGT